MCVFSYHPQTIELDISLKLTALELILMKCLVLFLQKIRKNVLLFVRATFTWRARKVNYLSHAKVIIFFTYIFYRLSMNMSLI